MHYSQILTAQIGQVLDLTSLKKWLKLPPTFAEDDDIIEGLEKAAREYAQQRTNRIFIQNMTVEDTWFGLPSDKRLMLKYSPGSLQEIKVFSKAANDWLLAWSSDPGESITAVGTEVEINAGIPIRVKVLKDGGYSHWKCQYVAGVDPAQTPETVKQAMRQLVAHWYEKREDISSVMLGVEAILRKNKVGEHG